MEGEREQRLVGHSSGVGWHRGPRIYYGTMRANVATGERIAYHM